MKSRLFALSLLLLPALTAAAQTGEITATAAFRAANCRNTPRLDSLDQARPTSVSLIPAPDIAVTVPPQTDAGLSGSEEGTPREDTIYNIVEENPRFPGGEQACTDWLSANMKYPPICKEQGIQGRVYAQFIVEKDGTITNVRIVRSPDPYLSRETERLLKLMPKWTPGKQGGQPVRTKFSLPVMFRIQ